MTVSALHTIQWKHLGILNVPCQNFKTIAFIMRKAVTEECSWWWCRSVYVLYLLCLVTMRHCLVFPAYLDRWWPWSGVITLCALVPQQDLVVHGRRDTPRGELPPAQDHWEGQLRQSQAGSSRPDWTGGRTRGQTPVWAELMTDHSRGKKKNCSCLFSWQVAIKIIDKTQLNPTSLQKVRQSEQGLNPLPVLAWCLILNGQANRAVYPLLVGCRTNMTWPINE